MIENPIIKALDEKVWDERNNRIDLDQYARLHFTVGHDTACAKLMPIVTEAVEIMYQIGLARCPSYMAHPQSVWFDEHVQSKAREFLTKVSESVADKTTLADASGEIKKDGK